MDVATVQIPYTYGQEFLLWPLADVHLGNVTCDLRKFKADINKAADTPNMLIVGVGDLLDSIIVTDERYRKVTDATPSESIVDDQVGEAVSLLRPVADKILCMGDGNHELTVIKKAETNPLLRVCKALSTEEHPIKYFGESWMLKINFTCNGGRGRSLTIRGHHGWGGGSRTQGADITKFSHDVKFWQADLFLYGHVHKVKADPVEEGRMVGKDQWATFQKKLLVCGTYQRTYTTDSTTTWAESKGFAPTTIGSPRAILNPNVEFGVEVKVIL